MMALIYYILLGILTSLYFFPIEFTFLPGVNTKMAMAGIGLLLLVYQLALGQKANVSKDMLYLSAIAMIVSLIGLIAVTYNGTSDYTYATYIVSMWVWMGGAYVVTSAMRSVHGRLDIELVCNYLIGVCAAQCISALMIDSIPVFKSFVDSYVSGFGFVDTSTLNKAQRLRGIGAGLDVAGLRFSTVLCAIAFFSSRIADTEKRKYILYYLVAFVLISLVGNMIARTTIVGIGLALLFWVGCLFSNNSDVNSNIKYLWKCLATILLVSIPFIVWRYNTDIDFKGNMRFAFEGFFSLVEKGEWDVHSNNILKDMIVFPENVKTWLIGDGYMENPIVTDPYYTGPIHGGYYMSTDIGYLRFVFYFGIFGLLSFIYFFIACTSVCIRRFPQYTWLFLFILTVNQIGWFKVSTDIFPIIALLLCVSILTLHNDDEHSVVVN
jgi:hypothetical protein